jgi:uncharacterized protein YcsI (UPF0317 family)
MSSSYVFTSPVDLRLSCREGTFQGQTAGQSPGYAQANLCILPKEYAFDFLLFCQRNPKPCPLLHVVEAGSFMLDDIDIRTDAPKYRVFKDGILQQELTDISSIWSDDLVTFVIGCSFSFEDALVNAGLRIRHIDQGRNVPMYNTNVVCPSAGVFHGNLVVSMRPFKPCKSFFLSRYTLLQGSNFQNSIIWNRRCGQSCRNYKSISKSAWRSRSYWQSSTFPSIYYLK